MEFISKCCFCGFECNPCSQSCGTCSRETTEYSIGWRNEAPTYIDSEYVIDKKPQIKKVRKRGGK